MTDEDFNYKEEIAGMICPITQEIMQDPVVTVCDGHSYERQAIEDWFALLAETPADACARDCYLGCVDCPPPVRN